MGLLIDGSREGWQGMTPLPRQVDPATLSDAGAEATTTLATTGARSMEVDDDELQYVTSADGRKRKAALAPPGLEEAVSPPAKMARSQSAVGPWERISSGKSLASPGGGVPSTGKAPTEGSARMSDTQSQLDGDDAEWGDGVIDNKTDYWIRHLPLHNILKGAPLGVQEHQAELRLKKVRTRTEEHPEDRGAAG